MFGYGKMQAGVFVCVEVAVCVCKHIICVLGTGVDGPGIGPVLGLWRRVPAAC